METVPNKPLQQLTPEQAYARGWQDRGATDATRELEAAQKRFSEAQYADSAPFVPTGAGGNSESFICCEGIGKHAEGCAASASTHGETR